jgi:hypothetical protein
MHRPQRNPVLDYENLTLGQGLLVAALLGIA